MTQKVTEIQNLKDIDLHNLEHQVKDMKELVSDLQRNLKAQNDASLDLKQESDIKIEELQAENQKLMDLVIKH